MLTLPADPETNWKTLPASLNTTEFTTWLLSVKEIVFPPFASNKVVDPGSKDSLYLLLSTEIAQKSDDVIPPKEKDAFSSPNTKVRYWPNTVDEGDLPSTSVLYATLTIVGRDSGARAQIPVTVTRVSAINS